MWCDLRCTLGVDGVWTPRRREFSDGIILGFFVPQGGLFLFFFYYSTIRSLGTPSVGNLASDDHVHAHCYSVDHRRVTDQRVRIVEHIEQNVVLGSNLLIS